MTDREAIRRLVGLVERLAYAADIELLSKDARELRRDYERFSVEPAAPALTGIAEVDESGVTFSAAPTVTREQAAWFGSVCDTWFSLKRLPVPPPEERPAIFRAVADALEEA